MTSCHMSRRVRRSLASLIEKKTLLGGGGDANKSFSLARVSSDCGYIRHMIAGHVGGTLFINFLQNRVSSV